MEQQQESGEREARLVRVVDQLRRRLDQMRAENEQLEEELRAAEGRLSGKPSDNALNHSKSKISSRLLPVTHVGLLTV